MSNFLSNPISSSNLVPCVHVKVLVSAAYLLLYLSSVFFFCSLLWQSLTVLLLPLLLSLQYLSLSVCASVRLPPLFPVLCYSISGIYLAYIISASLLCVASPSHLCTLPLTRSPPLSRSPSLILICILAIQLNRLWLCNELTSHSFFCVCA